MDALTVGRETTYKGRPRRILGAGVLEDDTFENLDGGLYWATWHRVSHKRDQSVGIYVEEVNREAPTWRTRGLEDVEAIG
jgi:hypothetical protein